MTPPDKVYHGTTSPVFEKFSKINERTCISDFIGAYKLGFYFSESRKIARTYPATGQIGDIRRVISAKINVSNPKSFRNMKALVTEMASFFGFANVFDAKMATPLNATLITYTKTRADTYRKHLMGQGFDSVVFHEGPSHHPQQRGMQYRVWVVFDPDKIQIIEQETKDETYPKEQKEG